MMESWVQARSLHIIGRDESDLNLIILNSVTGIDPTAPNN